MKSKFRIDELALVLIVAVMAMIAGAYKNSGMNDTDAEKITEMILDSHAISFANNGVVDQNKLAEIQGMHYEELKKSLKARNDFCVYLEDENGNIILVKGSGKLDGKGISCME